MFPSEDMDGARLEAIQLRDRAWRDGRGLRGGRVSNASRAAYDRAMLLRYVEHLRSGRPPVTSGLE